MKRTTIRYTVRATPRDAAVAADYIAWMTGEHGAEVLAAPGCLRWELLREPGGSYLSEYVFESREALDRYYAVDAPALRAKGLARFPPGAVTFERLEAEIVTSESRR